MITGKVMRRQCEELKAFDNQGNERTFHLNGCDGQNIYSSWQQLICNILLDLSKAFHTVNYNILKCKFLKYGFMTHCTYG